MHDEVRLPGGSVHQPASSSGVRFEVGGGGDHPIRMAGLDGVRSDEQVDGLAAARTCERRLRLTRTDKMAGDKGRGEPARWHPWEHEGDVFDVREQHVAELVSDDDIRLDGGGAQGVLLADSDLPRSEVLVSLYPLEELVRRLLRPSLERAHISEERTCARRGLEVRFLSDRRRRIAEDVQGLSPGDDLPSTAAPHPGIPRSRRDDSWRLQSATSTFQHRSCVRGRWDTAKRGLASPAARRDVGSPARRQHHCPACSVSAHPRGSSRRVAGNYAPGGREITDAPGCSLAHRSRVTSGSGYDVYPVVCRFPLCANPAPLPDREDADGPLCAEHEQLRFYNPAEFQRTWRALDSERP